MARMYMEGGKPKKSAVVPSSKRTGDSSAKKKVTVSQATIDKIKSQGMTAAIKAAAAGGASASYVEGVKRMYGAGRLAKATSSRINEAQNPKAYGKGNMPAYRPATAGASKPAKPGTKKKSGTSDPFAKAVFGGLGALGRTLSVEPRVTAAQAKARAEAKKRAAANKNK
jgi:hypothetical protein